MRLWQDARLMIGHPGPVRPGCELNAQKEAKS
jgi:hypothetical protein